MFISLFGTFSYEVSFTEYKSCTDYDSKISTYITYSYSVLFGFIMRDFSPVHEDFKKLSFYMKYILYILTDNFFVVRDLLDINRFFIPLLIYDILGFRSGIQVHMNKHFVVDVSVSLSKTNP